MSTSKFLKWNSKKIFLTVLFSCDVGENGLESKAGYGSFNVIHRKCQFLSENELIVQKYICLIRLKKKYNFKCSHIITGLHHVDLVRLFLFVLYSMTSTQLISGQ